MLVYLFGGMRGLTLSEANSWRKKAENFLRRHKINVYNPMKHVPKLRKNEKIKNFYLDKRRIKTEDIYYLKKADILLGRLDKISLGSAFEMGMGLALNKIIIVWKVCDEIREHPLLGESWDLEFETLEGALNYILDLSEEERNGTQN